MTDSVRRSIEAVTEGLELLPPGLHLNPAARPPAYSNPLTSRGRSAAAGSERRCNHDRRRAPATHFADESFSKEVGAAINPRRRDRVQIYAVSDDR
jgi:hypothetical protein